MGKCARARTVLLLGARHAGVPSTSTDRSEFARVHENPATDPGVAPLWIVGQRLEQFERLGGGLPRAALIASCQSLAVKAPCRPEVLVTLTVNLDRLRLPGRDCTLAGRGGHTGSAG
jgi:hypothetical protein